MSPPPVATRYVHDQAFCPRCRRPVVQAAADELLNAPIGPVAKSTAMYLRYAVGIPYRKVATVSKSMFDLTCMPASLIGFDRKAAKKGENIYADLREKIRASAVIHADETSWRNDGIGHYVWFAGNEELAFFSHRQAS